MKFKLKLVFLAMLVVLMLIVFVAAKPKAKKSSGVAAPATSAKAVSRGRETLDTNISESKNASPGRSNRENVGQVGNKMPDKFKKISNNAGTGTALHQKASVVSKGSGRMKNGTAGLRSLSKNKSIANPQGLFRFFDDASANAICSSYFSATLSFPGHFLCCDKTDDEVGILDSMCYTALEFDDCFFTPACDKFLDCSCKETCLSYEDCDNNEEFYGFCYNGYCYYPGCTGGDCGKDYTCVSGYCEPDCKCDDDCGGGGICYFANTGDTKGTCKYPCFCDDCPNDLVCSPVGEKEYEVYVCKTPST